MDGEITTKILIEIRDEIKATKVELAARLDQTNLRLDQTNVRLDQTNVRLDRLHGHVVESEVRLATAITDLAGTLHEVRDGIRDQHQLGARVDRCERDIEDLKHRIP